MKTGTKDQEAKHRKRSKGTRTKSGAKESSWPKWLSYTAIRSWGNGSKAQELERFRVGGQGEKDLEEPGVCNRYWELLGEPGTSTHFEVLLGTSESRLSWVSLQPNKGDMICSLSSSCTNFNSTRAKC